MTKNCAICGTTFQTGYKGGKRLICRSEACHKAYSIRASAAWVAKQPPRICEGCGQEYRIKSGNQKSCSRRCAGIIRRVGQRQVKNGYVRIGTPDGWRLEHRIIMEEHLGRKLRDNETVHHRNGDRGDNRIENLELWQSNHHPGQRVEDKIKWAIEVLRMYDQDALVEDRRTAGAPTKCPT